LQTTFERVKVILDQLCPALDEPVGQAQVRMKGFLNSLSAAYPSIWNASQPVVDYSDPACHAAYIFKYVTANSDLIYQALRASGSTASAICKQDSVTIACIGGGPNTELLALFKYLERIPNPAKHVRCIMLDHFAPWEQTFEAVLSTKPDWLTVDVEFVPMTLTDPASVPRAKIAAADIITFSYSLSEVWRYNGGGVVTAALDAILGVAKAGSMIIYSDNAGQHFDPHMERDFSGRSDLTQVGRSDYTHMLIGSEEQMDTVGSYRDWLDMRPKLRGRATTATFVKK